MKVLLSQLDALLLAVPKATRAEIEQQLDYDFRKIASQAYLLLQVPSIDPTGINQDFQKQRMEKNDHQSP